MKKKMLKPYMETARAFAKLSRAVRKKVGGIAITPQDIVIYSWNGRPEGDDNNCEIIVDGDLVTHPEVLHCESNLVAKAAREGFSLKGSTVVLTLSPCLACAKQLYQVGVSNVIYDEEYRDLTGVEFLKRKNINVSLYEESEVEHEDHCEETVRGSDSLYLQQERGSDSYRGIERKDWFKLFPIYPSVGC